MFDAFHKEKLDFLDKKDKSKKGSIDKDIFELLNKINSKKDHYTTSSCAGRIVLLEMKSSKKNECGWIFAKHDKVKFQEIYNALNKYSIKRKSKDRNNNIKKFNKIKNKKTIKNQIWFRQQPLILHVACRNLGSARGLLNLSRRIFRRAGIIGIKYKKVTIEIIGSEHLETIVADKNFIVDKKYLKQLIKYANENFVENKKKIGKFLKLIEKI